MRRGTLDPRWLPNPGSDVTVSQVRISRNKRFSFWSVIENDLSIGGGLGSALLTTRLRDSGIPQVQVQVQVLPSSGNPDEPKHANFLEMWRRKLRATLAP